MGGNLQIRKHAKCCWKPGFKSPMPVKVLEEVKEEDNDASPKTAKKKQKKSGRLRK